MASAISRDVVGAARMMWWRGADLDLIGRLLELSPAEVRGTLFAAVPIPVMRPAA